MSAPHFYPGQLVVWRRGQWYGSRLEYIPAMYMGRSLNDPHRARIRVLYVDMPILLAISLTGAIDVKEGELFWKDKPQVTTNNLMSLPDYYKVAAARSVVH